MRCHPSGCDWDYGPIYARNGQLRLDCVIRADLRPKTSRQITIMTFVRDVEDTSRNVGDTSKHVGDTLGRRDAPVSVLDSR